MLKTLSLLFRKTSIQASRDQALALVLDWLVDRLQVQAYALYARNPETHELRILVLRGEEGMDHPPPSLAGVVAQGFEPVRLSQPWRHPSYEPEPAVEQQRFQAYLGVPIIRLRKVLGVIEAQRTDDRQFDEDDTSLLLTIALQLSGMIEGAEPKSRSRRGQPEMYTGTPAAPGVAVGRVYTPAAHAALDAVPDRVASNVDTEIRDFQDAVSAVRAELRDSGRGTGTSVPEDLTALYQAYEMILEDPHLVDAVIARIRSGQWAPAAVRDATQELISRFEAVDDAYLRARAEDIRSIGRRILYHLQSHANTFADFPQRTVLLGQSMGLLHRRGSCRSPRRAHMHRRLSALTWGDRRTCAWNSGGHGRYRADPEPMRRPRDHPGRIPWPGHSRSRPGSTGGISTPAATRVPTEKGARRATRSSFGDAGRQAHRLAGQHHSARRNTDGEGARRSRRWLVSLRVSLSVARHPSG
jgi:hypothetical protein